MHSEASKEINIKKELYTLLFNCMNEDESLSFDYLYDFKFPKGLSQLKWPNNTVVEIKKRLVQGSLTNLSNYFAKQSFNKLILVVEEESNYFYDALKTNYLQNNPIEIKLYSTFKKELENLLSHKKEILNYDNEYLKNEQENNKERLKEDISNKKISLFLGAGVSRHAHLPSWNELLDCLSYKINLNMPCNIFGNIVKGRHVVEKYRVAADKELKVEKADKKDENNKKLVEHCSDILLEEKFNKIFTDDIRDVLYKQEKSSSLVETIAKLILNNKKNIESIITYNYDDLLERELQNQITKNDYFVLPVYEKIKTKTTNNTIFIYHVHGYVSKDKNKESSPIVLGEKEYHKIYKDSYNWGNIEQLHALNNSVCIFIGLSMTDPNLRRLIDFSLDGTEGNSVHYVFLREECEAYKSFMEYDMRSLGVNCIWYNKHDELPGLIEEILK